MPGNNKTSQTKPGKRLDGYPSARFGVEIKGVIIAEFTEVSGLEAEVEVEEYIEGGNNLFTYKFPGRVKFPNVTLKRGISDGTDLWDWFQMIVSRKAGKDKEPTKLQPLLDQKNISIVQYDGSRTVTRRWILTNAYPIKWTGPSFKADENAITIEAIELVHQGLTRENVTLE